MKKWIFFNVLMMFATTSLLSQTYHTDDKEGLRMFLRQPSAATGEINAERLGLTLSDTASWYANENWISNITGIIWNNATPKRLDSINNWRNKQLAGVLDAGKWNELTYLYCSVNELSGLDVSNCPHLQSLSCFANQLSGIDVSNCPNLQTFNCRNNQLTNLDVSNCANLQTLECYNNQLINLNVSNCTNLKKLDCFGNQLSSINASSCTNLTSLHCYNNQLSNIDVGGCTNLTSLYCYNNQLSNIDVSSCTNLQGLVCNNNQFSNLYVGDCENLTVLNCNNNQLTNLDISKNPNLTNISCGNNQLTNIDVSNCPNLWGFHCDKNLLTSLDLSTCQNLVNFRCDSNQLSDLDLSHCSNLRFLQCNNNLFTSLEINGFQELMEIYCSNNHQLTSLVVSNCPILEVLFCTNNQLTSLVVSNCPALEELSCYNNQLQILDLFALSLVSPRLTQLKRDFGTQNLLPKRVLLEVSLFSDQAEINGWFTEYEVTQNDSLASLESYTVEDGVLTFHDTGVYRVRMTNDLIFASYTYPAEVIVEITVKEAFDTDASLSNITVSAGILHPVFNSTVYSYTVDVPNEIDTITIKTTPSYPYATVSGDGFKTLGVGANSFTIHIIAEDSITTEEYSVTINRSNVGIAETQNFASLRIYPNPTTGEITIENEQWEIKEISIFDVMGRNVEAESTLPIGTTTEVNISNLPAGVYFLRMQTQKGIISKKIIKE